MNPTQIKNIRLATLTDYARKMKHLPQDDFSGAVESYAIMKWGVSPNVAKQYLRVVELRVGYVDRTENYDTLEQFVSEEEKPP